MSDQLRKAAQRDDSDNKKPKQLAVERERNFCERCGKRLGVADHIHTCTAPQPIAKPQPAREWVGLTDEEIERGLKESWVTEQAFKSAVWWAEQKLKEKNT
jgi:ribosomal protein S14